MKENEKEIERRLAKKPPIVQKVLREALNRKRQFGRILSDRELVREVRKTFKNAVDTDLD